MRRSDAVVPEHGIHTADNTRADGRLLEILIAHDVLLSIACPDKILAG